MTRFQTHLCRSEVIDIARIEPTYRSFSQGEFKNSWKKCRASVTRFHFDWY